MKLEYSTRKEKATVKQRKGQAKHRVRFPGADLLKNSVESSKMNITS